MAQTAHTQPAPEQPFHMGDRIRKARELTGQDRQTFAETVGIHRDTLAKYEETGKAKRSALISIAWATPVRLEWLESGMLPWLKSDESPQVSVKTSHFGVLTHATFGRPDQDVTPHPIAAIRGTR